MWPSYLRSEQVSGMMRLVQTLLAALAAYMSVGIRWPQQAQVPDEASYDLIIVGAGTAGCILANRLTEEPGFQVLLIEAGGDPPIESMLPGLATFIGGSRVDWNYETVNDGYSSQAHKTKNIKLTRGKMLGGSSSANLMLHVRGNPEDYNSWGDAGFDGWNWETALKYFIKSENLKDDEIMNSPFRKFHSDKGYMGITRPVFRNKTQKYLDAFEELGYEILLDANTDKQLVFSEGQYIIADGVRQSTATSFLAPIANRTNLHVLKHTLATKVIFDEYNNAVAIEALTQSRKTLTIKATREIIISAGSINTPQLLMLSGIGPKEELDNLNIPAIVDLPVGENLHDHITVPVFFTVEKASPEPESVNLSEYSLPTITGYVALNKSQKYPDYQITAYPISAGSKDPLVTCATAYDLEDEICNNLDASTVSHNTLFTEVNLMHPQSRGYVRLRSTDPEDAPLIYLGYYSVDSDLEVHARSIEDYLQILNTSYLRSVDAEVIDLKVPACLDLEFDSHEYWRCYAREMACTVWHPVGTTAMGRVVDARLRVYHTQRLRVVDAGVMPWITSGNTNAPIAMIAEHAADLIKEDNYC